MRDLFRKHRTLFSVIWLIFTLSLGIWWFLLALGHIRELSELASLLGSVEKSEWLGGPRQAERLDRYARQRTMILLEGSVFLVMLAVGGVILIWFVYKDAKRNHLIRDFFSTVTHEMKTPLASLQLQVENLVEDYKGKPVAKKLQKILSENSRIERQMNKAFYLASLMRSEPLFMESISLEALFRELSWDWPLVCFESEPGLCILGDRRALESILKNLFENSVQHGKATQIVCRAELHEKKVHIVVWDNGIGFDGNTGELGRPFVRHGQSSGTGIGIYITKMLIKKMKGKADFSNAPDGGFQVRLRLPVAQATFRRIQESIDRPRL